MRSSNKKEKLLPKPSRKKNENENLCFIHGFQSRFHYNFRLFHLVFFSFLPFPNLLLRKISGWIRSCSSRCIKRFQWRRWESFFLYGHKLNFFQISTDAKKYHTYYQWVCFVLFFQGKLNSLAFYFMRRSDLSIKSPFNAQPHHSKIII